VRLCDIIKIEDNFSAVAFKNGPYIPRLHDQAIIKQISSKHLAIRAHVVHVYFECIKYLHFLDVCFIV